MNRKQRIKYAGKAVTGARFEIGQVVEGEDLNSGRIKCGQLMEVIY